MMNIYFYAGGFSGNFSRGDICRVCHIQHSHLQTCIHDFTERGCHSRWNISEYDEITKELDAENGDISEEEESVTDANLFTELDKEIAEQNQQSLASDEEIESNDESTPSSDNEVDNDSECDEDIAENQLRHGLRRSCPLNKLESFHATYSFPQDTLHDIAEGVVAEDLLGCLRILIKRKFFSEDNYNRALFRHQYKDYEANDRPEKIDIKKKKLKGKAMSLVCHIRNVGMILSYLDLPLRIFEDRIFQFLMNLASIVERILAPSLRKYEIVSLEEDIIDYLNDRQEIYNEVSKGLNNAKPKTHFMFHLSESIAKYGPTGATWTARYESKHRVGKSLATSGKNFKNIAKTVAERQQFRQASIYYSGMYPTQEVFLPASVQRKQDLTLRMRGESSIFSKIYDFLNDSAVICDNVKFQDQNYKTNDVVVIDMKDQESIRVGLVQAICFKDGIVYFLVYKESFNDTLLILQDSIMS